MKKLKKKEILPELICLRKPNENCNDGFYEVRIPLTFMPLGGKYLGAYQLYRFIGLTYLQ